MKSIDKYLKKHHTVNFVDSVDQLITERNGTVHFGSIEELKMEVAEAMKIFGTFPYLMTQLPMHHAILSS